LTSIRSSLRLEFLSVVLFFQPHSLLYLTRTPWQCRRCCYQSMLHTDVSTGALCLAALVPADQSLIFALLQTPLRSIRRLTRLNLIGLHVRPIILIRALCRNRLLRRSAWVCL
jgi:hypothetical protein